MNNAALTNRSTSREYLIKLREDKYAEINSINEKIKEIEGEEFKKNSQKYIGKIFKTAPGEFYHICNYDPYCNKLEGALIKWSLSDISLENSLAMNIDDVGLEEVSMEEVKSRLRGAIEWIISEFSE